MGQDIFKDPTKLLFYPFPSFPNKETIFKHTIKSNEPDRLRPSLGPLTLPRSLWLCTGFHLLRREIPQISTRDGVAAFRVSFLSTESKFLVLLLSLC